VFTQVQQKRAWPHGTNATPSRSPMKHTSQQSPAGIGAGDVELCAAAGDDVVHKLLTFSYELLVSVFVSTVSCNLIYCIFMPCNLVRHFHALQFHVFHFQRPRFTRETANIAGMSTTVALHISNKMMLEGHAMQRRKICRLVITVNKILGPRTITEEHRTVLQYLVTKTRSW